MPKLGMEPIRRRQLIDATIAAIHEAGMAEATISKISARAGVSSGIIHHYFEDKTALLEATLRSLASDLRSAAIARLRQAHSPRARVLAVIEGLLAPEQLAPQAISAWLAFWPLVRTDPRFARIQTVLIRRAHSNLMSGLRDLLPPAEASRLATGLSILLDGLWLRTALSDGTFDREAARKMAIDYLDLSLQAGRRAG